MEAVCRGASEAGGKTLGVVIGDAAPNRWVTDVVREADLAARLRRLRDESEAAIFLPRGLGTMLELAWMVESIAKGEIAPRPLVFLGLFWRRTVALALSEAVGPGAESLADSVSFATSGAEAVSRAMGFQPLTR
jgi:predicted Rossmann-fold nucleotide-binding protein